MDNGLRCVDLRKTGLMAAFDPTSPFRRTDALAAGLTVGQLRGPGYRQLLRGVHVSSEVEVDVRVRARAALLVAPEGAAIARHTACELWDGWPPPDWRTHIVLPSGQDSRSARMVGQAVDARVSRSADGITTLAGIRLTDRVRTFLDLAADCDLVDLVAVGDSLVRRDRLDPRRLREAAATPGRHRLLARRAAALVRPRVMSRPESQLRMLLVLAGLPEPSVDVQFSDPDGRLVRRLDLGYRDHRVAVEYDGRQHADDHEQWHSDIDRREDFDNRDWRFVVVTSKGLWVEPERTLARVVKVLRSRGADVDISSAQWQRYFGPRHRRTA